MKKLITVLLMLSLLVNTTPIPVCAQSYNLENTDKIYLSIGETCSIQRNGFKSFKSSRTGVATISKQGLITAKDVGTTIITAKSKGKTYHCRVIVQRPRINLTFYSMEKGSSIGLTIKNWIKDVLWTSSNASVALVRADGIVIAVGTGTSKIKAITSYGEYTCCITVTDTALPATLTLKIGDEYTLPSEGWTSSNPSVIAISGSKAFALAEGTCTLSKDNHSISCTVPKGSSTLSGITLSKEKATISLIQTLDLHVSFLPTDYMGDRTIKWFSDNANVAIVNNGIVYPTGTGTVIITAVYGSHSASCHVTITGSGSTSLHQLKLSETKLSITEGENHQIHVSFIPVDYSGDGTVTWISSSPAVASVDETGKVTGNKVGTANITAICNGVSSTCIVTVNEKAKTIMAGGTWTNLNQWRLSINSIQQSGETLAITYTYYNDGYGTDLIFSDKDFIIEGANVQSDERTITPISCGLGKSVTACLFFNVSSQVSSFRIEKMGTDTNVVTSVTVIVN